jgi:ribosomal-protein-alanine N-acetyltransferase
MAVEAEDRVARVRIRPIERSDQRRLLAANRASVAFHAPWVSAPTNALAFAAYLEKLESGTAKGFLALSLADGGIVGVVNLSNIAWGAMKGAAMGYYANRAYAGQGLMREGIARVLDRAFGELGLHRIEANVQPGNARSLALVRRLGFHEEGFSPRFLFIDGAWRDHQRWALLAEEWHGTWRRPDQGTGVI